VRTQSFGIEAPPLDEPGMAELGAAYFHYGCLPCHGAPGRQPSSIARSMLPDPPSLHTAAVDWSSAELFWIIHNGQKYTGMPAWLDYRREDEVWPLVAFMKALPDLDAEEYAALAGGPRASTSATAGFLESQAARPVEVCISCHGASDGHPVSPRVPRLGGQSADYLERALREFAANQRPSGMMELFASRLSETEMTELAGYYATGSAPAGPPAPPRRGDPGRGEEIFAFGIPAQNVPACGACHVVAANPHFPKLEGQSAIYVRQQLEIWKEGLRDGSAYGAIMARIAGRLTDEQMGDVAAYIENLPPFGRTAGSQ
jgi:cytochrome c553